MQLPFTKEQLFDLFAAYNVALAGADYLGVRRRHGW